MVAVADVKYVMLVLQPVQIVRDNPTTFQVGTDLSHVWNKRVWVLTRFTQAHE